MAPMIVERSLDSSLYLTIGSSGGSRIFPAIFHTFLQLEWGHNLLEAIQHARFYDQLFPEEVETDSNAPVEIVESLIGRGHNVVVKDVDRSKISVAVNAVVTERDGQMFGEFSCTSAICSRSVI
jgi:gamma-glutamyltranspeptidase / glutathione hydrolase / leukotriene-C4 hydrolase